MPIAVHYDVDLSVSGWSDFDGVKEINFYFSYDGGEIFVPFPKSVTTSTSLTVNFPAIYKATETIIKCEATDVFGFSSSVTRTMIVINDPAQSEVNDLTAMNLCDSELELNCLNDALSLNLMLQEFGALNLPSPAFEIFIEPDVCTQTLCNDHGVCRYIGPRNSYHCECETDFAGRNCTFAESKLVTLK